MWPRPDRVSAPDPQLSVVIAAWQTEAALRSCLAALEPQRAGAIEVLAVANFEAPPGLAERHPWLTWLRISNEALIPELWAAGIAAARGEIVVTTTAHLEPAPDWLRSIGAAHRAFEPAASAAPSWPPRTAPGLIGRRTFCATAAIPSFAGSSRPRTWRLTTPPTVGATCEPTVRLGSTASGNQISIAGSSERAEPCTSSLTSG